MRSCSGSCGQQGAPRRASRGKRSGIPRRTERYQNLAQASSAFSGFGFGNHAGRLAEQHAVRGMIEGIQHARDILAAASA